MGWRPVTKKRNSKLYSMVYGKSNWPLPSGMA